MTTLITGASRGIGRGLFEAAADAGEAVIGTFRAAPPPDLARRGEWRRLDVADPSGPANLARDIAGRPIDMLVCNAAIYPDKGHRLDGGFPPEMWTEALSVNVRGVFLTVQALLPSLRAAKAAKVALIASDMGSQTLSTGGAYIYRASKAAVINIGRNLAVDLARDKIAVGIYHPGWVKTDMGAPGADLTVEVSVRGLRKRFADLSPATTGCFEAHDGRQMPF